jgi:hypothetical protein
MITVGGLFACHTLILLVWFKVYARTKSKVIGGTFLVFDGLYNSLWASIVFLELPKNKTNAIFGINLPIFETLSERIKRYKLSASHSNTWRQSVSKPIYKIINKIDPGHFENI